jgi:hypothetical protein
MLGFEQYPAASWPSAMPNRQRQNGKQRQIQLTRHLTTPDKVPAETISRQGFENRGIKQVN